MHKIVSITLFTLITVHGFGQDDKTWWKNLFSKETNEKNSTNPEESINTSDGDSPAEKTSDNIKSETQSGQIKNKAEVDWVLPERLSQLNDSLIKTPPAIKGYRVVIFAGTLDAAKKFRSDFVLKNPDTPCYLQHAVPNFEVRIGNCREKGMAYELLHQHQLLYPGAYVVRDDIEMPPLSGL